MAFSEPAKQDPREEAINYPYGRAAHVSMGVSPEAWKGANSEYGFLAIMIFPNSHARSQ